MNRIALSPPEIGIIASTRAALGAGLALLLAPRLNDDQRRAVGWTLLAVGAVTTVPIVAQLIRAQDENAGNTTSASGGGSAGTGEKEQEHALSGRMAEQA
jgi:hypothetical protein